MQQNFRALAGLSSSWDETDDATITREYAMNFDDALNSLEPPLRAFFDGFSADDQAAFRQSVRPALLELHLRLRTFNWAQLETLPENVSSAGLLLEERTAVGGPNDPDELWSSEPWLDLIRVFKDMPRTGSALARRWYRHLVGIDRARDELSKNRGIAAYTAGWLELQRGDVAAARRWLHIAVVEDSRANHNGVARSVLIESLGENPSELDSLKALVLSESATPNDFRSSAEYILTRWYLSRDLRNSDLSLTAEHDLDSWLLAKLTDALPEPRPNTKVQGDALEILAAYLLSHIVGCFPVRKSETPDFENDLVIRNLSRQVSPALDLLGRYFLVECKNWKSRIGTHELAYFANRIRYGRLEFGILFARAGISTGTKDEDQNGEFMVHRAYHQDGVVVVVVTADDLKRVSGGLESPLEMILRKHDEVRFGAWSRQVGPRDRQKGEKHSKNAG